MDYSKLSDRELDELVGAQVMDLTIVKPPFIPSEIKKPYACFFTDTAADIYRTTYTKSISIKTIPNYSTDNNAARLVRDRIAELDSKATNGPSLRGFFLQHLAATVSVHDGFDIWRIVHATPRQQCIVALMALDGVQEGKKL